MCSCFCLSVCPLVQPLWNLYHLFPIAFITSCSTSLSSYILIDMLGLCAAFSRVSAVSMSLFRPSSPSVLVLFISSLFLPYHLFCFFYQHRAWTVKGRWKGMEECVCLFVFLICVRSFIPVQSAFTVYFPCYCLGSISLSLLGVWAVFLQVFISSTSLNSVFLL